MTTIRSALESYHQSMAAFAESHDEGEEPSAKDYEYRDDDAVRFAAEADTFITKLLAIIDQIPAVQTEIERSREADSMDPVFEARDAADDLLTQILSLSQGGTQ